MDTVVGAGGNRTQCGYLIELPKGKVSEQNVKKNNNLDIVKRFK